MELNIFILLFNYLIKFLIYYSLSLPNKICNINPFATNISTSFISQIYALNGLSGVDSPIFNMVFPYESSQISANIYVMQKVLKQNAHVANEPLRTLMSLTKEQMILYCSFGSTPCNLTQFSFFYHQEFGNCFQFNSGFDASGNKIETLKTIEAGKRNGLSMVLFVGSVYDKNSGSMDNGGHIIIHNKTTHPKSTKGIDLATG